MIAVVISYVIITFNRQKFAVMAFKFFKISPVVVLIMFLLYLFPPASLVRFEEKMSDAIQVTLTGQEGNDVSANARLAEIALATPYIVESWLLGNGFISNQWNEGFKGVIGYFHPSDIGLMGVVFEFGAIGLMLFSWQFYYFWKFSKHLQNNLQYRELLVAIKGMLLYFIFNSLSTGRYVFLVEQSFFCIALMYCATKLPKINQGTYDL
jgi:hypothetical protein